MIKRLRNRFISIAMLSVTAVMLLLTIILNVANYVSTDSDLKQTLTLIYENAGTIPHSRFLPPSCRTAPTRRRRRKMTAAAATSPPRRPTVRTIRRRRRPRPTTKSRGVRGRSRRKRRSPRAFLSCTTHPSGTLTQENLDNIASVTADDTQEYLSAALAHGAGLWLLRQLPLLSSRRRMTARISPSSSTATTSCVRCAWCSSGRCSPTRRASCSSSCSSCCSRAGPSTQWFAARSSRSSSSPTRATN